MIFSLRSLRLARLAWWAPCVALLTAAPAWAQTTASEAWIRGTVAQQKATGAFMQIQSAKGGRLVGVSTPVAGVAEVHEMKMVGDVMKMNAVDGLDLPAGQAVKLQPGGYHVMLMDLRRPLQDGEQVPLVLRIQRKDGSMETLTVQAQVRGLASPASGQASHAH